ncbi:MAG: ATP-binding protein [Clostridia bacterium]|nr:ATP-binding protein [Clostridia bacterium]
MDIPYEQMLNLQPDGVVAIDLEGFVTYCNAEALNLLGLKEPPIGKSVSELNKPNFLSFLSEARSGDRLLADYHSGTLQITYQDLTKNNLRSGAMLLLCDLGEKQRTERIRREFTANVSHELKTPLTSISGYAEMIATGMAKREDIVKFASKIHSEANRMLALISDIIKLSELDELGRAQHVEEVDLFELANECVEILNPAALLRGVSVRLYGSKTTVIGNRSLLAELIYNLLDNAIRYNRDNGSVKLRVAANTIKIRDTGIGIAKKHQEHIFERFYRVDKSRSKETGGTGLGLAIVKHICEQHRAELLLESREGVGTSITIIFPQ